MKSCIQLKATPFKDCNPATSANSQRLDMTPVDYVGASVAVGALRKDSLNRDYNVVNPEPVPYYTIYERIKSFGFDLEQLPYNEWRERLLSALEAGEEIELAPMAGQFGDNWTAGLYNPKYDRSNLDSIMKDSGMDFPDVTEVLMRNFNYFVGCGFIEAPTSSPNNSLQIDWATI